MAYTPARRTAAWSWPSWSAAGGEALSELFVVGPMSVALRKALFAVGIDPCENSAGKGEGRQRGADHLVGSHGALRGASFDARE